MKGDGWGWKVKRKKGVGRVSVGAGPRFGVVFCGIQTDHGRWDGGNMEEMNALA